MKKYLCFAVLLLLFAACRTTKLDVISDTQSDTVINNVDTSLSIIFGGEEFVFDSLPQNDGDWVISTPANPGAILKMKGETVYIKTPADTVEKVITIPGQIITKTVTKNILVPTIPWYAWAGYVLALAFLIVIFVQRRR